MTKLNIHGDFKFKIYLQRLVIHLKEQNKLKNLKLILKFGFPWIYDVVMHSCNNPMLPQHTHTPHPLQNSGLLQDLYWPHPYQCLQCPPKFANRTQIAQDSAYP